MTSRVRAVLVDDEPPARSRLRHLLEADGGVTIVGETGNAADALALIRGASPDVIFLDIQMPDVRGTTLAAQLPEPRPFVVFATACEHFAREAFACAATDYLLKPIASARLASALVRVRHHLDARSEAERDIAAATAQHAHMWARPLPHMHGYRVAAASMPARGVGGDFYDVFPRDARRWAIALGDVSGKGVPAGMVASAMQGRVHALASRTDFSPAALVGAFSDDAFRATGGARYSTMGYAEIDAPTGALDTAGREFGGERLESVARRARGAGAEAVCAHVLEAVRRHRGAAAQHDDATVVAVIRD
jgi:serine phosphatase RsbU (regulator of sigma subunit)